MAIFDHAHSKIIEAIFSFPEFVTAWQKMTLFHLFIFESCDQADHTNFGPCPLKKISISFKFLWSHINMQKMGLFLRFIIQIHWSNAFLTMLTPENFNHLLICKKLY